MVLLTCSTFIENCIKDVFTSKEDLFKKTFISGLDVLIPDKYGIAKRLLFFVEFHGLISLEESMVDVVFGLEGVISNRSGMNVPTLKSSLAEMT